jgi:hypothetical protein
MSVFTVSFNLDYDDTYTSRYNSFVKQLRATTPWWDETTSFIIVSTSESIDDFCYRIYVHSEFNQSKDRFLVLDANAKSGRYRGPNRDADLLVLLPYVVKL